MTQMISPDGLGDRMKSYEDCFRMKLPRRIPKVLRIDGRAFHTFLKDSIKPYDRDVMSAMKEAAKRLMKDIGGIARFAYIQSDECSIAINDHLNLYTEPWFDNNIQKMVSVAASEFSNLFNEGYSQSRFPKAAFDARVFILPDETELVNYFIWRQQDASRNSIQQYARLMYSHKELEGKSNVQLQEMMYQKFFNWDSAATWTKRGIVVTNFAIDYEIPIFTTNRDYLTKLYLPSESEEN